MVLYVKASRLKIEPIGHPKMFEYDQRRDVTLIDVHRRLPYPRTNKEINRRVQEQCDEWAKWAHITSDHNYNMFAYFQLAVATEKEQWQQVLETFKTEFCGGCAPLDKDIARMSHESIEGYHGRVLKVLRQQNNYEIICDPIEEVCTNDVKKLLQFCPVSFYETLNFHPKRCHRCTQ